MTKAASLRRLRLSIDLLLGRRARVVLICDALIVLLGYLAAMLGEASAEEVYQGAVLAPFLLLGVPVLADAIPLERRAVCLDLALASPGAEGYFERRVAGFAGLMAAQGGLILLGEWALTSEVFPLVQALVQMAVVAALLAAAALFWGSRLGSHGAVAFSLYLTVALLGRWLLAGPFPASGEPSGRFFLPLAESLEWLQTNLVLAIAATVFYLYARRRLDRPECLLG